MKLRNWISPPEIIFQWNKKIKKNQSIMMQGDLHHDGLKNKRDITQMKIMIDSKIKVVYTNILKV